MPGKLTKGFCKTYSFQRRYSRNDNLEGGDFGPVLIITTYEDEGGFGISKWLNLDYRRSLIER